MSDAARAFAPIGAAPDDARLLLLGSLPGRQSLTAGAYYAHPHNQFWRLVGALTGADFGEPEARGATLAAHGIMVWDVIEQAVRPGSLDQAIRGAVVRPLAATVAAMPRLRAIGFNGQTAARLGRRALGVGRDAEALGRVRLHDLPSSSPAYTMAFADKLAAWHVLAP